MTVKVYTDGACRGNPGLGSWAFIVEDDKGTRHERSGYIGPTTNNRAEYIAIIEALKFLKECGTIRATLYSDSQVVVNQICEDFVIKNDILQTMKDQVDKLAEDIDLVVLYMTRESKDLKACDRLCNYVLDHHPKGENW
jgi:ribonuclease HI